MQTTKEAKEVVRKALTGNYGKRPMTQQEMTKKVWLAIPKKEAAK